jgi:cell division protein ZapA
LITAVERVDTAMCKIRDAGKVKARDRIAVLAALNLAFETEAASNSLAAANSAAALHSATSNSMVNSNAGADARLTHLLAKLDQALLTSDGQLL